MLTLLLALALGVTQPPTCTAPDGSRVVVEIARTDEERALGLMFRDQLAPDRGMLFLFDRDDRLPFWMKNTFIPLDLIWLTAAGEVVEVQAEVQPCRRDPCPSYQNSRPARVVLEVNAGYAAAHGIGPGTRLTCQGVNGFPATGGMR